MRRFVARTVLQLTRPERLAHLRALEAGQWDPPERIRTRQAEKLARLLRHALQKVPFYRDLGLDPVAAAADPLATHAVLPRVDRVRLTAAGDGALAAGVDPGRRVPMATGGSTGSPFRFQLDLRSRERRVAQDLLTRQWAGWRVGDQMAQLWGHRADVSQRERLAGRIRNVLANRIVTVNTFALRRQEVAARLDELARCRPALLIGYASALGYFAGEALRRGDGPWPGLRGVISSAETLLPEMRSRIEAAFGCPVYDRYGSREFGVMAQQCERREGLHVTSERLLVEVLDPSGRPCGPGERGEITITDLDNEVMPFLRYRTGDLAAWADGPCPCGRGLAVLARVDGRTSDLLVGRGGRIIACPGPTFFLRDIEGVKQLQIRQETRDAITMVVVPGSGWGEASRARLVARMQELLGDLDVHVRETDHIATSASGKYRFSISRVSPYDSGEEGRP